MPTYTVLPITMPRINPGGSVHGERASLAKIGLDTDENEPSTIWHILAKSNLTPLLEKY